MEGINIELQEKVRTVLAKVLNVGLDEITAETAFGDLPQWDSMGHMEVMIVLEENFSIDINADTISGLVSVPAICEHVSGL
jgi:acyl carrier protein